MKAEAHIALKAAVELLRAVLAEVPADPLRADTRARISALVRRHAWLELDASDAPTVPSRPRLIALTLTLRQYLVLERAFRSKRLHAVFGDLHDLLLAAGRGYTYAPPPDCAFVVPPPHVSQTRTIAFRKVDLDELKAKAVAAGAPSPEVYVLGCAFHWLEQMRAQWPDDADLAATMPRPAPSAAPVEVVRFPTKGRS